MDEQGERASGTGAPEAKAAQQALLLEQEEEMATAERRASAGDVPSPGGNTHEIGQDGGEEAVRRDAGDPAPSAVGGEQWPVADVLAEEGDMRAETEIVSGAANAPVPTRRRRCDRWGVVSMWKCGGHAPMETP